MPQPPSPTIASAPPPRILVVEDDEVDFRATRRMLAKIFGNDLQLDWASTWDDAVAKITAGVHDVYLIDYHLGGHNGLDLVAATGAGEDARAFIFLTGQEDHALDLAATRAGAADFLVKSDVTPPRLERSIRYAMSMTQTQNALHRQADALRRAHRLVQEQAERYLKNAQELAAAQRATRAALVRAEASEGRYRALAERDVLTGLANRAVLTSELDAAIARARRSGQVLAVLYLDLDRFKRINDTLGHAAGDALIVAVGQRLVEAVRETDLVARLGGDEFAIVLTEMRHAEHAAVVAAKILAAIARPFEIAGNEVQADTSIGIALLDEGGDDAASLLNKADVALYKAKEEGRGAYRFFDEELDQQARRRQRLESDMAGALAAGQFVLEYQPQVSLDTGRATAVEALIRWQHPTFGRLPPAAFMPIAEACRFTSQLTPWVVREACRQAKAWQLALTVPVPVAVNLAAADVARPDLAGMIAAILAETALAPSLLQLEIAEAAVLGTGEQAMDQLWQLSSLGVKIVLDDFGTGYSVLKHARHVPIDRIKIGRSFVADMAADRRGAAVVHAAITLARHLKVSAVVHGIESVDVFESLVDTQGVDLQGFLISLPLADGAILDWLRAAAARPAQKMRRKGARFALADMAR